MRPFCCSALGRSTRALSVSRKVNKVGVVTVFGVAPVNAAQGHTDCYSRRLGGDDREVELGSGEGSLPAADGLKVIGLDGEAWGYPVPSARRLRASGPNRCWRRG